MRACLRISCLLLVLIFVDNACAQSLNDRLAAEKPESLVEDAIEQGNIVRGAILFHQGSLNCAKCHRSQAAADRFGPDLSRIEPQATNEYLVESILHPSRKIKEGFETVTASTADGRIVAGVMVEENDRRIVIRDILDVDNLITIDRDELDDLRPSKKSSMPDKLADALKDRQQFLDLLRYVIDVKERGPGENTDSARTGTRRELSPELNGLVLMQKLNCVACHKSESLNSIIASKKAPRLDWSGARLNPAFIQRFIAAPHTVKPGSTMPDCLGHLDETTRQETAEAITHFLVSKTENSFKSQQVARESIKPGFRLFHSVGCVACHAPRNENGVELKEQPLEEDSIPLGELSSKYDVSGLVAFLGNPLAVRSSGHMPGMKLSHREAIELASYLLQSAEVVDNVWKVDSKLVAEGKSLFAQHQCAHCHTEFSDAKPLAKQKPLEQLNLEQGCLSNLKADSKGEWPNYYLDANDRADVLAAIKRLPIQLTDEQRIDVSMKSFNCHACHDRGELGGVEDFRNHHFQTTNMNLGDQGRIPPTLTGVGAKIQPNWMRDVLVNGRSVRPYMNTRMPQYGEENVGYLVELFQNCDQLSDTTFAKFEDQKAMRKKGLQLAGSQGLNCVACHTYKYKDADTMPAVDLTEMAERLKKDWYYQYMLDPQKFSPNTVMPSFWPGGSAIRKDLAGTPEDQVEALWQYLIDGRQARMPRGVVREKLEIVVADEAQMLRRSYAGIGKRGIGVGYPGGVNIAFDAEQLRLAMIWKGKFIDPGGVWTGQGSGNVRPMVAPVGFTKGPDLDSKDEPWVVDDGRPPLHRFQGYTLDEARRPTFRYVFNEVEVEDFFTERTEQETTIGLRRQVALMSANGSGQLKFRIASGTEILTEDDGSYSVGNKLSVQLDAEVAAVIVDTPDGKRLEIPVKLEPNELRKLTIDYNWEK